MQPQVPINVDAETGVWDTDGLPMLYVPRHFFVNNHTAIAEEMGAARYAEILYPAGYKSAYYWCAQEAGTHGLSGMEVFRHYLQRLSQRGWGQFAFIDDRLDSLQIAVTHSAFVLHARQTDQSVADDETLCYMFAGWFAGAADWVAENQQAPGGFFCYEKTCAIHAEDASCVFIVERSL